MATYNINVNLPGAKKVFNSEPVTAVGSSTVIPMFVVAMDADNMQQSIDGYALCETNTNTSQVVTTLPVAVSQDQLVGHYAFVTFPTPEVRQIIRHPAAALGASVTFTVSRPFTAAPSDGVMVNVRLWEDFNVPKLYGSFQTFAEEYVDKSAAGAFEWTNLENVYYTLTEFKANGGTLFYVLPVPSSSDAGQLADSLGTVVTDSAAFKAKMLALTTQPDVICMAKQPSMQAALSTAQWAIVDSNWMAYVEQRKSDETEDDAFRQLIYVTDTGSAATASAVTYRTSDWNSTSESAWLYHGQYMTSSLTSGLTQAVSVAPAVCGVINRVATGSPESYGHALDGGNYTQIATLGLVEDGLTPANRVTLAGNSINALISKPGRGSWLESQTTQAKSPTDSGADPIEHCHVVLIRSKIWHQVQPILDSIISEPNTAVVRAGLVSRLSSILESLKSQSIILDYTVADVSSSVDVTSGTVRIEMGFVAAREIDYVELKLTAKLGG